MEHASPRSLADIVQLPDAQQPEAYRALLYTYLYRDHEPLAAILRESEPWANAHPQAWVRIDFSYTWLLLLQFESEQLAAIPHIRRLLYALQQLPDGADKSHQTAMLFSLLGSYYQNPNHLRFCLHYLHQTLAALEQAPKLALRGQSPIASRVHILGMLGAFSACVGEEEASSQAFACALELEQLEPDLKLAYELRLWQARAALLYRRWDTAETAAQVALGLRPWSENRYVKNAIWGNILGLVRWHRHGDLDGAAAWFARGAAVAADFGWRSFWYENLDAQAQCLKLQSRWEEAAAVWEQLVGVVRQQIVRQFEINGAIIAQVAEENPQGDFPSGYLRDLEQLGEHPPQRAQIAQVYAVFERHSGQLEANVQQIAAELHISAKTLGRRTEAFFGMSPVRFLQHLRLTRALQYLKNTALSVHQIAQELGFGSVSHFSYAFKKRFGYSPKSARLPNP